MLMLLICVQSLHTEGLPQASLTWSSFAVGRTKTDEDTTVRVCKVTSPSPQPVSGPAAARVAQLVLQG